MNPIRLSIIIVTWNIREVLKDCLVSLYREDLNVSFEVILFDNGSEDGTPDMVEAEFPQVSLIRHHENLGFPKANNRAIEHAQGDYIVLLNSDTVIIEPSVFSQWVEFMDRHPEAGASGCRLQYPDGNHQVGDAGFQPGLATVFNYAFFLSKIFPRLFRGLFVSYTGSGPVEVDWICGADLMVRRSILPEVGVLDEDIFIFAEDIEWGCRIKSKGHKVYYLPDLRIVHLHGATTDKYPTMFSGMPLKNLRGLYRSFNPRQPLILYDLIISTGFLLRCTLYWLMFYKEKEYRASKIKRMCQYFKSAVAQIGTAAK